MNRLILTIAAMLMLAACDPTIPTTGPGPTNVPYLCTPSPSGLKCVPNPNYRP